MAREYAVRGSADDAGADRRHPLVGERKAVGPDGVFVELFKITLNGVSNIKSYNCVTLPSQVSVRKMEHESTAEMNSLLLDSSNWNFRVQESLTAVIEVAGVRQK